MRPRDQLPIDESFESIDQYVETLLGFVTSHELFTALCGGVHILGFFTVEPEIYASNLPVSWRDWFSLHDVATILDLLLREDFSILEQLRNSPGDASKPLSSWRGSQAPPQSLIDFIVSIRRLSLRRKPDNGESDLTSVRPSHSVVVGMKPKKIHETQHFAKYIRELQTYISCQYEHQISHIVDFGSGQNYLGRTLASPPHNQRIIAVERKQQNIGGAQVMDVHAKLTEKAKTIRNKKAFRNQTREDQESEREHSNALSREQVHYGSEDLLPSKAGNPITYVEQNIENGDLSYLESLVPACTSSSPADPQFMVISLHSCGDLLHHGLRSLASNSTVKAVAMIGCCYHLNSDRVGPPTWKPPYTRPEHLSPNQMALLGNPNGFPLSERLLTYRHRSGSGKGIKLNITARMMASQAATNWTEQDCDSFFTRHFYRALLQKLFLDRGVLAWPGDGDCRAEVDTSELASSPDLPITIGSLRKACYTSFVAYVRGAMQKLSRDSTYGTCVNSKMQCLTDEEISAYDRQYSARKKELSIMWTLMAFVASVTESTILVDRFLYLREQPEIDQCWVQPVFDYKQSPRNLAVIGIKK